MRSESQTAQHARSETKPGLPEILLSESQLDRLEQLLHSLPATDPARELLGPELERALLCDAAEMPPDVVTMHSRVKVRLGQSTVKDLTLVYPAELSAREPVSAQLAGAAGRAELVSVLAPIGMALLGLRVGAGINWPTPAGVLQQIEVLELLYQPERDGPAGECMTPASESQGLASSKLRQMPR
jgi:regulator of nucleoside diphosphate kinase